MGTRVDIKHLQALLGIADHGSFSGAAEALGTVQSNVSAHVAKLERELDAVLVDRSSGQLTEEGGVVAARARRIVVELDAMVADVVAMRREVVGKVRVGMIGTTGRWLVPKLFGALQARHPHIHMTVADGTTSSLELQLVTGMLDVAVMTLPIHSDELSATPLFDEDLMLVVPEDHELVKRQLRPRSDAGSDASRFDPLPLATLSDLQLVLPAPGTALREEIDAALRPGRVKLHPLMEVDGLRMIASLAFDGYGPAILPATAVSDHLRGQFQLIPLEGFPRRRVGFVLQSRGLPSAPTRVLIDMLYGIVSDEPSLPVGLHANAQPPRPAPVVRR
jgi:DNA-binding transcriptional LysR family regulator